MYLADHLSLGSWFAVDVTVKNSVGSLTGTKQDSNTINYHSYHNAVIVELFPPFIRSITFHSLYNLPP